MHTDDTFAFRLSIFLFVVVIPLIGGVAAYFASNMPS